MKCGISQEELEQDAFGLLNIFNQRQEAKDNPFTKEDVLAALEGYDSAWMTYPIEKMSYRTDIPIQKNKRNYQKQEWHLEDIRSKKANMKKRGQSFKNPEGRPQKKDIVQEWRKEHPQGTKYQCTKETGLSKNTVKKWWDGNKEVKSTNKNDIPKVHSIPQNIIRTRSDSDTVSVTIQLPKSTIDQINNMTLKELETFMEVQ